MKTRLFFSVVAVTAVIQLVFFSSFYLLTRSHSGYIVLDEVFNGFSMKTELEAEALKVTEARSQIIDSMSYAVNSLKMQLNNNPSDMELLRKLETSEKNLAAWASKFEDENTSMVEGYDRRIWERINQYVKEFGDEEGYQYIHGVNRQGNLMYAGDENNLTEKVLQFINMRYEGKH